MKNFIATLMLSRGVPMLLGGDEFGRSQSGNNNAYCQDNETSWYDWSLLQSHRDLYRFTCDMVALRKRYPVLSANAFYIEEQINWFDPDGYHPDWNRPDGALGCHIHAGDDEEPLCLLFNPGVAAISFVLPEGRWRVVVDTADTCAQDFPAPDGVMVTEAYYRIQAHSLVVLATK